MCALFNWLQCCCLLTGGESRTQTNGIRTFLSIYWLHCIDRCITLLVFVEIWDRLVDVQVCGCRANLDHYTGDRFPVLPILAWRHIQKTRTFDENIEIWLAIAWLSLSICINRALFFNWSHLPITIILRHFHLQIFSHFPHYFGNCVCNSNFAFMHNSHFCFLIDDKSA